MVPNMCLNCFVLEITFYLSVVYMPVLYQMIQVVFVIDEQLAVPISANRDPLR